MRITADKVILADHGSSSVHGLARSWRTLVQTEQSPRAAESVFFNRGNIEVTLSFEVARLHDSIGAAEKFVFEHPEELAEAAALGTVTIITEILDGQRRTVRQSVGSVVMQGQIRYIGATTFTQYQIISGLAKKQKEPLAS